jgi:dUTP pyrophosphatase
MNIKKLSSDAIIPTKGSEYSAGYDLYSIEEYELKSFERKPFKTGIAIAIPKGLYGRVAPRSGLAVKKGIDVLAGIIDQDYRGEILVVLINLGNEAVKINKGDKIAQIIFENYTSVKMNEVNELDETVRGESGFGSTDNIKKEISPIIDRFNKSEIYLSNLYTPEENYLNRVKNREKEK